jgi:hypothetical protein
MLFFVCKVFLFLNEAFLFLEHYRFLEKTKFKSSNTLPTEFSWISELQFLKQQQKNRNSKIANRAEGSWIIYAKSFIKYKALYSAPLLSLPLLFMLSRIRTHIAICSLVMTTCTMSV